MEQNQKSSLKALLNINKGYTIENLLATLFVVTTFKNPQTDRKKIEKDFEEIKKNWDSHIHGPKRINPCPYSTQIINNFFDHHMKQKEESVFISNLIGQICFLPDLTKNTLDTLNQDEKLDIHIKNYFQNMEQYTRMIKIENQPYYSMLMDEEMELGESGEFTYAYEYLLTYINNKQKHKRVVDKNIYDSIRVYFKYLPYIAKDFPKEAEKSALALLHLTKQLFTHYSSNDLEAIRSLLNQVQLFRRWSYPVGPMASDLVNLLFQECKSHGNAYRQKVREEMPMVDFQEHESQTQPLDQQMFSNNSATTKKNSQSQQLIIKEQQPQNQSQNIKDKDKDEFKEEQKLQYQQEIDQVLMDKNEDNCFVMNSYVIADEESQESSFLIRHAQKIYYSNQIKNAHLMRASLIANILSMTMQIQENTSEMEFMGDISNLSYEDMFIIYCRLLEIIEQCEELDSIIDNQQIQETVFSELTKEIKKLNTNNQYGCINSTNVMNVLNENQITFLPEFPISFLHSLTKFNQFQGKSSLKGGSLNPNMNYDAHKQESFQQSISKKGIQEIIEKIKIDNLPLHQEPLRFIILGGDSELQSLTQSLGELFEDPKTVNLFHALDFRIYLVPVKKLTLSRFIAAKDHWYNRYLFIPYREEILAPKVEEAQEKKEQKGEVGFIFGDKNAQLLLPYELKLKALNTYIREADKIYNVRVYKINCVYTNNHVALNPGQQSQGTDKLSTAYFCQYLEIGASVEAEMIRLQKKDKKDKDGYNYYDLKEKNLLKHNYNDLTITTCSIDFVGNIGDEEQIKGNIHNLRLNNVYKEYFEGNFPYGNVNWLELSYITYENSKIFDENLREKKYFKKYDRDQLQSAFQALHTSLPVYEMKISANNQNQGFDILVDGKIIQGLSEITIVPVETNLLQRGLQNEPQNQPLKLPIVTFLPLKL